MIELKKHIKELTSLPGLSGYEGSVRTTIESAWKPLVDEMHTSRLGSLHGLVRGSGIGTRKRVLLAAHMDAIGLMVTQVEDGFLRVNDFGSIDYRILPGQLVTVHAGRDLPGIVVQPPAHLLPPSIRKKPVKTRNLMVDVGLSKEEVESQIFPGTTISFSQNPIELSGDVLAGHSMDNRVSVAAITFCLQEIKKMVHLWDVWAVATVQEEETYGGAITSPFEIKPHVAIAIDVTHAGIPGVPEHLTAPMGKGPTLGFGGNIHPEIYKSFKELAEDLEIPFQTEVMPGVGGTDAHGIQTVAEGIPTFLISIPVRYMHTPVETVNLSDVKRVGRLLAAFINRLEPDYLNNQGWITK